MKRRLIAVLVAIAAIATTVFLLRSRGQRATEHPSGAAPNGSSEAATHAHARPGAPQRVLPTGGETKAVEEGVIGHLEGRVVSSSGNQPIVGAEITFVGPDGAHSVRSGEGGNFDFKPGREGLYEMTLVAAANFVSFAPELGASPVSWLARKGTGMTGITLRLDPSVDYLGVVLDPRGAPVPRAEVRIFDADNVEFTFSGFATRHVTDEKGEFHFRAPDGSIVEARHAGFGPGRAELGFGAQTSKRLVVTLAPAANETVGAIRGTVVDASGIPLPDVAVVARVEADNPAADAERLNPGGSVRTDPQGAFVLEGLLEGNYSVAASDGDHAPAAVRPVHTGAAPIKFVLTNGATLAGRVTDERTGAPIPAISVVLSERRGPLVTRVVRTATIFDADGRYVVRHIASGKYLATVSAEGYAPSPEREIAIDHDATLDFTLSRGARLVGEVRDAKTKEPIESAKVSLEGQNGTSEGTASLSPAAISDRSGHFELLGVGPGERSFLVAAAGHHGRVMGGLAFHGSDVIGPIVVELTPAKKDEEPRVELVGIGAALAPKDDTLVIGKVIPGGGAAEAGLDIGDLVLSIDGTSVTELGGFGGAIQKIRGPEGTKVTLLVQRKAGDSAAPVVVVRRRISG
jgi:protocatechuate 3,4-dioxygenase beta subunit